MNCGYFYLFFVQLLRCYNAKPDYSKKSEITLTQSI